MYPAMSLPVGVAVSEGLGPANGQWLVQGQWSESPPVLAGPWGLQERDIGLGFGVEGGGLESNGGWAEGYDEYQQWEPVGGQVVAEGQRSTL